jgi:hypothetical protein
MRGDGTIEVASDGGVVFAHRVDHMGDMVDHQGDASRASPGPEIRRMKDDSRDATGVCDGAELIVIYISPVRIHATDAGMGDEQGL